MRGISKASILCMLTGAVLIAGCGVQGATPGTRTAAAVAHESDLGACDEGPVSYGLGYEPVVHYGDATFRVAGSVRVDAVDGNGQFTATGLVQNYPTEGTITEGSKGCPVLAIAGHPISDGYAIRDSSPYPGYCVKGGDPDLVFGVSDSPIPQSSLDTPTPTTEGVPAPPTATPYTPVLVRLSKDGLLEAGWPHLDWNRIAFQFDGKTYQTTSWYSLDPSDPFPSDRLSLIQKIDLQHAPDVNIPTGFPKLALKDEVTDELRVYKVDGNPESDALIIDACPMDRAVDTYLFFQASS